MSVIGAGGGYQTIRQLDLVALSGNHAGMGDESAEVRDVLAFLQSTEPFASLDDDHRRVVAKGIEVAYFRRGTVITDAGDANDWLSLIRSGAVELMLGGTQLSARLGERDCFGYPSLIRRGPAQNTATAIEDCLLYRLPGATFHVLRERCADFRKFFDIDESARLRRAVARMEGDGPVAGDESGLAIYATIGSFLSGRPVVSGDPALSVGETAALMAREDVSTLPLCEDGRLLGIVTDKDLRRRVLAVQLDLATPVRAIMTTDPITIGLNDTAMTALLEMTRRHIHHLPVIDASGALVAVISASDVLGQLGAHSLRIPAEIERSASAQELATATARLPDAVSALVSAGVDASHVTHYASAIGGAAHCRLLELAQAELGPPPVPFALVCFGSLARYEQGLGSDQDNGFVLGEGYDEARHNSYFAALAKRLSDGLAAAGYAYCKGDIMATNPDCRRDLAGWQSRFGHWIATPDPQAVLDSAIFFDMRPLAGEEELVKQLREGVFAQARDNRIFLSFMARAAASTAVPLGFFRNFLLHHDADEGDVLDLKRQAIAPIVDIARCHALARAIPATGTLERLDAGAAAGGLHPEAARDLAAGFEFLCDVRFRHQAGQRARGEPLSNLLPPRELSRFDREHLRDAFRLIRGQLDKLRSDFAGGLT
ncbi:cyclic nucleotide-binding/CBS domain-containing protein [Tsuneonella flava]|uniref:Cyclic nucleotide-binding/CBS domain-containing protein n=1 Tax=Tsuneonella flava TaxID=2055955 RepID=A0ABX7KB72_9SPHN|nr:putative nucleotidyltransferase substrate binding domain-containing protein [Tsuneonella flava]QSB45227.1 cyclic nucleotide-binding/CBS domain-containing protein [Tsuneonella flava]